MSCKVGYHIAQVDRLAETKGLDFLDRERAKRHAVEQAKQMYDSKYVSAIFVAPSY